MKLPHKMKKTTTSRRQVLKTVSITALSAIIPTTFSIGKASLPSPDGKVPKVPDNQSDLCFTNAVDLVKLMQSRKISAREVMQAHLKQIARVNPKVNAIITMVPEDQLMKEALAADESIAAGKSAGPLHGLPFVVKDLAETKGLRTAYGSPVWKDNVPQQDSLFVERQRKAGVIILGKSNVPELGMGSQTFNTLFGPSFNPYDTTKTCGGSTGGGAVALACGMAPLIDGTDMAGSLRNPGSFNNVVGLRPSPGRVPTVTGKLAWLGLSVAGPMARTVTDCALLLSVQAGPDSRCPISIMESPTQFAKPLDRSMKGVKVAFIKDFGLPWEEEVKSNFVSQRKVFESLGCVVEEAEPDFADANDCFLGIRHWQYEGQYGDVLDANPDKMNDYVKWHVAEGRKLTGPALSRLEARRSALFRRMQVFLEKYEFLVMPVSQVLPFDVHKPFPTEIAGVKMQNYLDWMRSAYYLTTVGNPAISVPAGFSNEGLPIGLQIVGRHNADLSVLQMGFAFEQATKVGQKRPGVVQ
jgi:amidase